MEWRGKVIENWTQERCRLYAVMELVLPYLGFMDYKRTTLDYGIEYL